MPQSHNEVDAEMMVRDLIHLSDDVAVDPFDIVWTMKRPDKTGS